VDQDKPFESAVFMVSGSEYFKMTEQEPHPAVILKVQQTTVSETKHYMSQLY
jgi:hypothetical protein